MRERRIGLRALAASVALAVLMKADFFAILSHLDASWDTLGWVRPAEHQWTVSRFLQALDGTIVTGIALAFRSKFWHGVLDLVYGVRPPDYPLILSNTAIPFVLSGFNSTDFS